MQLVSILAQLSQTLLFRSPMITSLNSVTYLLFCNRHNAQKIDTDITQKLTKLYY